MFLFPTHEENEGIALLEAMTAGKAVVVRDIETFSWLDHDEDCLKVDPAAADDETEAFADAIRRLTDPTLRERLGSNAAARSESFSLDAIAERYRSLYESV